MNGFAQSTLTWQARFKNGDLHISGATKCPDAFFRAGLELVVEQPPQPTVMSYKVVFYREKESSCGPDLMGPVNHVEQDLPASIARIRVVFDGGQVEIPISRKDITVEQESKTRNTRLIIVGFILMLGGILVALFGQGHFFLVCLMGFTGFFLANHGQFRKNRDRQIKNDPTLADQFEARPATLKNTVASLFLTSLPITIGILSMIAQGIVHDYHWGLGGFDDHAHSFTIINAGTVGLASAVVFLIVAVGLVVYRIRESRKPDSSVWLNLASFIVTIIVILVGGVLLLVSGWFGAMGGS